ncbi:hypothetical protein M153_14260002472 [Pseudoloma neurophilia]|uniref:Uncharacterized protein n=1 Tax=Pseudoloma neurophilia TaxID=146866 RepID=A0A0R0LZ18_9MICR|nr:hypothetical protein M153_14260002472 [Pseudoloma neurophilia]
MHILFLLSTIFCGDAPDLTVFQTSNVTDKQPYAYTKLEYLVGGVAQDLKSSGISVINQPICYQTIIRGRNPNGFKPGTFNLSFWADKLFTLPANNSVFTIQGPKNFKETVPTGTDASATFTFEIPAGVTDFCIIIEQNPFIGVSVDDTATPPKLSVTAENLPVVPVESINFPELKEAVPVETLTSPDTSYSNLLYNCARAAFKKCLEAAVIDCTDRIDKGLAKIIWCNKLKQIRCFISEKCKKVQVCPPQPVPCVPAPVVPVPCVPQPCAPVPCVPQPPAHAPVTPCTPITPFQFLDVCIRATILLNACVTGGPTHPVYTLAPYFSKPYHQYIAQCDRICFPGSQHSGGVFTGGVTTDIKARVHVQPTIKPCPQKKKETEKKKTEERKKTQKDSSEESSTEEESKSRFTTGAYIAGGVGVVVVVSVCVYVGYQFLS